MNKTIQKAREQMVIKAPFWHAYGSQFAMVEDRNIPTAGIDGRSIYFNPEWIDKLTTGACIGLLVHEYLHVANGHHLRRNGRDQKAWNVACDYAINPMILQDGFDLPGDGLVDPKYYSHVMENGKLVLKAWHADKIFRDLFDNVEQPEPPAGTNGRPCDDGDSGDDGEDGEGDDTGSQVGESGEADDGEAGTGDGETGNGGTGDGDGEAGYGEDCEEWDDKLNNGGTGEGKSESGDTGTGNDVAGSGGVMDAPIDLNDPQAVQQEIVRQHEKLLDAELATHGLGMGAGNAQTQALREVDSRVDWRQTLEDLIRNAATNAEHRLLPPNTRALANGFIMHRIVYHGLGEVAFIMDTSGSRDQRDLADTFANVKTIFEDVGFQHGHLIEADSSVERITELNGPHDLPDNVAGRGGTWMCAGFDWLAENGIQPDLIMVFTDLELSPQDFDKSEARWDEMGQPPTIWVADYDPTNGCWAEEPTFGDTVVVDPDRRY